MTSVIICAGGIASRMAPYSQEIPKALFELEPGVTIMDHIIQRIESVKPRKIILVTRERFRELFEERFGDKMEIVGIDEEEFGNLYTVYVALDYLDEGESFLITMSDHVFEASILSELMSHQSDKSFTLCLDRNPSRAEAIEGLKISLRGGEVTHASKKIPPHYGIDTGLIMCRGRAKEYIAEVVRREGPSATIADAINLAASKSDVDYIDITGKLWKDVDTPEDLMKARELYWDILRRELIKPEDGLISRYLNRPISTRISLMLYRRRIQVNPAAVTVLSAITCLISAYLISQGVFLWGGILAQLASVLDGIDGELARLFRRTSAWGGFFDSVVDRLSDVILITGLAVSLSGLENLILLAVLASANTVLVSYITSGLIKIGVDVSKLRMIPATRDARIFAIFIACLLSSPHLALWYISTLPLLYLVASICLAYRVRERGIRRNFERRKPLPELPESGEVSSSIREIISNSLKMGIALLIIRLLSPVFSDLTIISQEDFLVRGELLLTLLDFIVIIYFGYKVLMPAKMLFDIASDRFAERMSITKTTLGRMATDIFYMIIGIIAWIYLPSIARPMLGDWASRFIYLGAAAVLILATYDFIRVIYRTFEDLYAKIVEDLAKRLRGG